MESFQLKWLQKLLPSQSGLRKLESLREAAQVSLPLGAAVSFPAKCRGEDPGADYKDEIIRGWQVLGVQSMPVSPFLTDSVTK